MSLTRQHREQLETVLAAVHNHCAMILDLAFPEFKPVPFRVFWCDASDLPWTIRVGDTMGECIDFDGFDLKHLMRRFNQFGVSEVREKIIPLIERIAA